MQSLNQKSSKEDKGETSTPVNNKLTHRSLPFKERGEEKNGQKEERRVKRERRKGEERERRINKRSIEQKHTKKEYTYFFNSPSAYIIPPPPTAIGLKARMEDPEGGVPVATVVFSDSVPN